MNTAKVSVLEKPEKVGNSRLLLLASGQTEYVPETCFFRYNPGTKQATIETWILDKKQIPFKV